MVKRDRAWGASLRVGALSYCPGEMRRRWEENGNRCSEDLKEVTNTDRPQLCVLSPILVTVDVTVDELLDCLGYYIIIFCFPEDGL